MQQPRSANLLALDFEFNRVSEELVNLVSCVTHDLKTKETKKWWIHNSEKNQKALRTHLLKYKTILGYACVAEARSFLSLNLDPLQFEWIDLFLEYRMLTNHNDDLQWGKQLVDGKVRTFKKPPPKWERTEEDTKGGFKPTHSLAEATYKLTGEIRDTKEKDRVRELIISDPKKFSDKDREDILNYNADDVEHLPVIWSKVRHQYDKLLTRCGEEVDMNKYKEEAKWRGRYSAHTALMESAGYPIDLEATKNFSRQIPYILSSCQRDINSQFDIKPFKWISRANKYSWDQKVTKQWIEDNCDVSKWMKTKKGALSLSLDAFEKDFAFKHDYPRGNFGAQIVRFLKLRQSLYGFSDTGGKRKNFWDSVGSDGRVRPYMNIYGAQSGRSQPAASGFMFLKPAWMRSLVKPEEGKFLAGVDYGQQEFFLSGLLSLDKNMIDAYLSGDPYLFGAKLAGAIPQEGTKKSHQIERDLFKNTYLGILYGMSKYGLATKLTGDTGRKYTEKEAQNQIVLFENNFTKYVEWKAQVLESYEEGNLIRLQDGWIVGPNNPNPRSVQNVGVQGCIHGEQRILVKDLGYIEIQKCPKGKNLEVWDGRQFSSASVVFSGMKDLVEIKMANGLLIRCSPDHRFLCVNGFGTRSFKTPKEFSKTEHIVLSESADEFTSNYLLPENFSSMKNANNLTLNGSDDFKKGILLGRLSSDGTNNRGKGIVWRVADHEKEVAAVISKYYQDVFGGTLTFREKIWGEKKNSVGHEAIAYSTSLYKQLEEVDIDRPLHGDYIWKSRELLRGFLVGYIDGDGGICISKNRESGSISVAFGSGKDKEKSASLLVEALSLFGVYATVHKYSESTRVRIRSNSVSKFIEEIGFIKESKNVLARKCVGSRKSHIMGRYSRVTNVKFTGIREPMYDVVDSDTEQFMTSGVVTHNSGSVVMRKAVDLAVEAGCRVIFTLHDAIYIEGDVGKEQKVLDLMTAMREAFIDLFKDNVELSIAAANIKLDPFIWGPDYEKDSSITVKGQNIPCSNIYKDKRALNEYERFSKYFLDPDLDLL